MGVGRALTCFAPEPKVCREGSEKKLWWWIRWDGLAVGCRWIYLRPTFFCLSSYRHRKVVQNPQATERERNIVKPNTAGARWGGLGVAMEKWSRTPTLYTTTRQSNIVGPFTPRETRSPGRRGWCAVQRVSIWVFFS